MGEDVTRRARPATGTSYPGEHPGGAVDGSGRKRGRRTAGGVGEKGGSIAKALAILEGVTEDSKPTAISDLAVALDLPKPTGHRIAKVLEEQGFLGREPGTRRFVEGQRLVELALKVLSAFAQRAPRHAILQALSEEVGETCNLGVLAGNQVVYLDRVEAVWPLGLNFSAGSRVPLHCTSIGKLLLSHQPRRQRERLVTSVPFKRYTENTITEPDRLMAELERIRERAVATDNQEFLAGVVCVAVPVAGPGGRICAGLAISAPEARLTLAEALRHVPTMRDAAARLSETLSGQDTGQDDED